MLSSKDEYVIIKEEIDERIDFLAEGYGKVNDKELDYEAYVDETVNMAYKINYYFGVCRAFVYLATHYTIFGKLDEAKGQYGVIEKLIEERDVREEIKLHLYASYMLYYSQGSKNYNQALYYGQEGLKLAKKYEDTPKRMQYKFNLGVTNVELGFYDTAVEFIEGVIGYYESVNDKIYLMYCYSDLGIAYYHLEEYDRAYTYSLQANELAIEYDEIIIRYEATVVQAKIKAYYGDLKGALAILYDALDYIRHAKNRYYEFRVIFTIADLYNLCQQYDKGFESLLAYEEEVIEYNNSVILEEYYKKKAESAKNTGDFQLALAAMKKHHTIYKEEKNKQIEHEMNIVIQKEYRKEIKRLESIEAVGRKISRNRNLVEIIKDVSAVLSEMMEIDCIGIGRYEKGRIYGDYYTVADENVSMGSIEVNDKNYLSAYCVRNNEEIISNDFNRDYSKYVEKVTIVSADSEEVPPQIIQSLIFAPLTINNEIIGVFTIQSYNKNAYDEECVKIFNIILSYLSVAYKNLLLQDRLKDLTIRDNLTDMYNRRGFIEYFDNYSKTHQNEIESVAMLMLDLDYFKKVNDDFGHVIGDLVLCYVAEHLIGVEEKTVFPARLGGEEFGVITFNKRYVETMLLAKQLHKSIGDMVVEITGFSINVSVSIGVAYHSYSEDLSYNQLYFEADKALDKAKESGRDQIQFF